MKDRKGFTLIELMIVIAIIAIIAAIAIPSLLSARRSTNEKAALAIVKNFSTAAVQHVTSSETQYYWDDDTDDFGTEFAHVATKGGYNFYYVAPNTNATAYVYIAVPVAYNSGHFIYAIDENTQIYQREIPAATAAAEIAIYADHDTIDTLIGANWAATWNSTTDAWDRMGAQAANWTRK